MDFWTEIDGVCLTESLVLLVKSSKNLSFIIFDIACLLFFFLLFGMFGANSYIVNVDTDAARHGSVNCYVCYTRAQKSLLKL